MSAFTGPLTMTHMDANWREWRLEQPFFYEAGSLGSGRVISVPVGFVTDGASVPRPLWWLLPAWGRYSRAALIHDFLCVQLNANTPHVEATTRRLADAIFYEAMGVCGTKWLVRNMMWLAVRLAAILKGDK